MKYNPEFKGLGLRAGGNGLDHEPVAVVDMGGPMLSSPQPRSLVFMDEAVLSKHIQTGGDHAQFFRNALSSLHEAVSKNMDLGPPLEDVAHFGLKDQIKPAAMLKQPNPSAAKPMPFGRK
jgi:hypothetical protein